MKEYLRTVDELGRIVLPVDIRSELGLLEKTRVRVKLENNQIVICKTIPSCILCGTKEDLKEYREKIICTACQKDIAEL